MVKRARRYAHPHIEVNDEVNRQTWRVALVTGASSGIGEAFARELLGRGCAVIGVARRAERLARLGEGAPTGVEFTPLIADLGEAAGREAVASRLRAGGIDLVVNNAGLGFRGRAAEQPIESIERLCRVNLETAIALSIAATEPMVKMGNGALINVISMSAFQAVPNLAVYAATKAGLLSFTEGFAEELRGSGVRVQALCPGNIQTEFQELAGTRGTRFDRTPSMSRETLVRLSLVALQSDRIVFVPRWSDRLALVAQRLLPRFVPRRVAGRMMASP